MTTTEMTETEIQQPKAEPPKWRSEAGPIQTKKVQTVLRAISQQHQTYTELSGVKGVDEHSFSYFSPFGGGSREDVTAAWQALGDRFGWCITRENCKQIEAEATAALKVLAANLPVVDKRRTEAEEADRYAEMQRRNAEQEAIRAAKAVEQAQRITTVTTPATEARTGESGITVRRNTEHDGVEIQFPGKPEASVIARCKAAGFRWSFRSKVWYKRYGAYAWAQAHTIAGIPLPGETDPGQTDDLQTEAQAYNEQAAAARKMFPGEAGAIKDHSSHEDASCGDRAYEDACQQATGA